MLGDHLYGVWGPTRAPQIFTQISVRLRAQMQAMDFVVFALEIALARPQQLLDYLKRFVEAGPTFILIDSHALVLATTKPTADAANDLATGAKEGVQHIDVLGHPYWIVPGQHHDHRAKINPLGNAGNVSEVLQRIGNHRIRREVMLDGP